MAVNKRIKRRIILLAPLCLVLGTALAGVYFYSKWNKQKQIDYAYEQGMAAYESGDFVKALPLLSKAAAGIKDDADLIFALGRTRLKNVDPAGRHITAAEKYFLFLLSLDSSNQEALEELVRIYSMTNNSTNTLLYSDRIENPTPEVIRMRVRVLGQNGRFEKALEELERIRRIEPDDPIWALEMIGIRERMGETPTSILDDIELTMMEHPDNQGLLYGKVHMLQNEGRNDSAADLLREFVAADRIHPEIILMLGDKIAASGLEAERDAITERIMKLAKSDAGVANSLVDRRLIGGQYESAVEIALQAAVDHPEDLEFLRKAASVIGLTGDHDRCEQVYTELVTRSNQTDTARGAIDEDLVNVYRTWSSGTPEEKRSLVPDLERLMIIDRTNQMLRFMLAEMLASDGRTNESLEIYRDLFETTGSRDAGRRLVNLLIMNRRLEEAVAYSTNLLSRYPNLDSFITQSKALIALKRARGGVLNEYSLVDTPTGLSDRILASYRSMVDRSAKGSQLLLGILAESASLEGNRGVLEFAVSEALKADDLDARTLLSMAVDGAVVEGGWSDALVLRARGMGVEETDVVMTKARRARLAGRERDALTLADDAYELAAETEDETTARRRQVLAFVAASPLEEEAVERMRWMMNDLDEDAASVGSSRCIPESG